MGETKMLATKSCEMLCDAPESRDRARLRILLIDPHREHGEILSWSLTGFGLPSCAASTTTEGAGYGEFDVIVDFTCAPRTELLELQRSTRACLVLSGTSADTDGRTAWEARVLDWQISCALARRPRNQAWPAIAPLS